MYFQFPIIKSLNKVLAITCNSIIAPNKHRLEHNNLATIRRENLKGAYVVQEYAIYRKLKTQCKP